MTSYAGLYCPMFDNLSLLFHNAYKTDTPKPSAPPIPHLFNPAESKYKILIKQAFKKTSQIYSLNNSTRM